jgi:hypothetical protein
MSARWAWWRLATRSLGPLTICGTRFLGGLSDRE